MSYNGGHHPVAVPLDSGIKAEAINLQFASAPSAPPPSTPSLASRVDEGQAQEFLSSNGWPMGLQLAFVKQIPRIAFRYFIVDDSGSMMRNDGNRIVSSGSVTKIVKCSRWNELCAALKFHINLARNACAPSEFRLLNGGPPIVVGTGHSSEDAGYHLLLDHLDQSPGGATPLCKHIREVVAQIAEMEGQLRATGQKVFIVIATDGESSDGDIARAMRPLKSLPVMVVVRLCTDEADVVHYWNEIDKDLEIEMDVIDDQCGEAAEIYEFNNWLTYGEALHRAREFGFPVRELDLLDEAMLSTEQLLAVCALLFGGRSDAIPHPDVDWKNFVAFIDQQNKNAGKVWNPIEKRDSDWVSTRKLARAYRKKGGCSIM